MFTHEKLTTSTLKFQKYVEPQLYSSGMFDPNNSYVILCEGDRDDLKTKMDRFAGIDMCTIDTANQVVQGIASRVQQGPCWRTFTIRAITDNGNFDTELKKRALAIRNGDMYPTWTIQAYISSEGVNAVRSTVGIVRTVDLFGYVINQIKSDNISTTSELIDRLVNDYSIGTLSIRRNISGSVFLVCDWNDLIKEGIHISVLEDIFPE